MEIPNGVKICLIIDIFVHNWFFGHFAKKKLAPDVKIGFPNESEKIILVGLT